MFYSIDNDETLSHIYERWNKHIKHLGEKGAVVVIIGNKSDLENTRQITEEEGI